MQQNNKQLKIYEPHRSLLIEMQHYGATIIRYVVEDNIVYILPNPMYQLCNFKTKSFSYINKRYLYDGKVFSSRMEFLNYSKIDYSVIFVDEIKDYLLV
jgi:hypothetical protein